MLFEKFHALQLEALLSSIAAFKTSVVLYKSQDITVANEYITVYGYLVDNDFVRYLCHTCRKSLTAGRTPTFAITDELQFPEISQLVARLTDLEQRFVSPLIPFMTIRVTIGDQYLAHGRAVNEPTNVVDSVQILPQFQNDTQIIPIFFRRKKLITHIYYLKWFNPQ